jgi:hypothetical protein
MTTSINAVTSIVLEGRSQSSAATVDSSFPQATLDSSAEVWLLSTQDTTVDQYIRVSGTTISGGSITFPISGVPTAKLTRNTWQFIIWGLNGNTAPTPVPTSQYFAIKSIRGSLAEISISTISPLSSQLIQWQFLSAVTNFTVISPQYTRPILNSAGSFRWDFSFSTNRPWYYTDQVIFDLSAFTTASQNSNANTVKCRITDTKDIILQQFSSCTYSQPNITIVAIQRPLLVAALATSLDFNAGGIRIYIDGVRGIGAQAITTVNGKVVFGGYIGGSTVALTKSSSTADVAAPTDVASKAFPSGYPVLNKVWLYPSALGIHAFTLITNAQITDQFRITIEFPTYYNPGLAVRSGYVFCTVNDQAASCIVVGPRSLQVIGLPTSISSGNTFVLKVGNIPSPATTTTTDVFWIQINSDRSDAASTVVYAGTVSDTAGQSQTITPLHVNWLNVSLTATRAAATYTWTFNQIGSTDSDTNRSVHVLFPEAWGLSWGIFTPVCSVIDYANASLVYTKSQTIFGDIVMLNLSTTLPMNRIVNLVCDQVRTPDNETTYPSQDIHIRVVSLDGTRVYQQSASNVHNVNWGLQFSNNPNIQYIDWAGTPSTFANPVPITRGTYGPQGSALRFLIPSRSSKPLRFSFQPQFFIPSTNPLDVPVGSQDASFWLGCPSSTPLNRYGLTLSVNESTSYIMPKPLYINVTLDKLSWSFPRSQSRVHQSELMPAKSDHSVTSPSPQLVQPTPTSQSHQPQ